jgi:methionyl-tRNA synthetase
MAAGIELPKQIVSHGWWLVEGEKISKSLGNVIDPMQLIKDYGLDQVRYYMMREISFGNDGSFSQSSFILRVNSELSNKIGNLVQRTLSMVHKNCDASIPNYTTDKIDDLYKIYILVEAQLLFEKVKDRIQEYQFHKALEEILLFVDHVNIFVDQEAPWGLKKTDPARMAEVLYTVLESVRYFAILLLPFIPDSANKILDQLLVPIEQRSFQFLTKDRALGGGKITSPAGVFPRIVSEEL